MRIRPADVREYIPDARDVLCGRYIGMIEDALDNALTRGRECIPARLLDSMAYSVEAGGKRLRPVLCLAAAENGGTPPDKAMPMALAIEFIHTASLIHDDLPCMDDDGMRRGKPANHKVFGECLAMLAGDSLMLWSFGCALSGLMENGIPADRAARAVGVVSAASGPEGMCGGQTLDTDSQSHESKRDFVRRVAEMKTAALIRASVTSGALISGRDTAAIRAYSDFGAHLGLAFQIVDDILDATGASEQLGKTAGKDAAQGKRTFVSAYGIDGARQLAEEESEAAARALSVLGDEGALLMSLAKQLTGRSN